MSGHAGDHRAGAHIITTRSAWCRAVAIGVQPGGRWGMRQRQQCWLLWGCRRGGKKDRRRRPADQKGKVRPDQEGNHCRCWLTPQQAALVGDKGDDVISIHLSRRAGRAGPLHARAAARNMEGARPHRPPFQAGAAGPGAPDQTARWPAPGLPAVGAYRKKRLTLLRIIRARMTAPLIPAGRCGTAVQVDLLISIRPHSSRQTVGP